MCCSHTKTMMTSFSSSPSSCRRFIGEGWTPVSTRLERPISSFAYASLDEDRHFLFDGRFDDTKDAVPVVEYNSMSKKLSTHTPPPEVFFNSAATAIDEHRFLVVGGASPTDLGGHYECSCRVYDTRTKKWSTNWPALNNARFMHACVCTNNKVYAIGGYCFDYLNTVEELDLSLRTPEWRVLPQRLQKKRSLCSAVVDPTNPNNIIVVGGAGEGGDSCEIISLTAQEGPTETIPPLTTGREGLRTVVVENRFIVAMGGCWTLPTGRKPNSGSKRPKIK